MKNLFRKMLLAGLVGCFGYLNAAETTAPSVSLLKLRAAEFKKVTATCPRRLVYLSWDTSMNVWRNKSEQLAAKLRLLGFTDVIVALDAEKFYGEDGNQTVCRNLLKKLGAVKIRAWALISNHDLFAVKKGGWFSSDQNMLNVRLKALAEFNKGPAKFAGVILEAKPHLLDGGESQPPVGSLYQWSHKSYGIGLDNDILMTRMFDNIAGTHEIETLPFGFLTSPEYSDKAQAKKLRKGHVNDFLKHGGMVILESFSSSQAEAFRLGASELRSTGKPRSIILGVCTVPQTTSSDIREIVLNAKGWKYFVNSLAKLVKSSAKYKTFGGLYFYDFAGIESILDADK
jgi:hypothetical protein